MEGFRSVLIKDIKGKYVNKINQEYAFEETIKLIKKYFGEIKKHIEREIELSEGDVSFNSNEDEIVRFSYDGNYIAFSKKKDCIEVTISDIVNKPYDKIIVKNSIQKQNNYYCFSEKLNKKLDNDALEHYLKKAFEFFIS